MTRAAILSCWFATLALAACGGGDSGGGDGGAQPGADLITYPTSCTGTLKGFVEGSFDCKLSMMSAPGEQDVNFAPQNPPADLKQLLLVVANVGDFKARSYKLSDLVGTSMVVTTKLSERYVAEYDGTNATGSATLKVYTPPAPPAGSEQWVDTAMHGLLDAVLPLDPNSPGTPGSEVDVHIVF